MTIAIAPSSKVFHGIPSNFTFEMLVSELKRIREAGLARAKYAVDVEKTRTAWEMGRFLHFYILKGADRTKYGDNVIGETAKRLALEVKQVYKMHRCYQLFPNFGTLRNLAWSKTQLLLPVEDEKIRLELARKTLKNAWTVQQLKSEIKKLKLKALPAPEVKLPVVPVKKLKRPVGRFFVYKLLKLTSVQKGEDYLSLDLGMGMTHTLALTGIQDPQPGELIESVRTEKNVRGDKYRFRRLPKDAGRFNRFTYAGIVEDLHDADTYWIRFDLGFRFEYKWKVRLAGIDAPELGTPEGDRALAYVKAALAKVSFVVLVVSGREKFGRTLVDLFYLPGSDDREEVLEKGIHLNQELLDLGLARPAEE